MNSMDDPSSNGFWLALVCAVAVALRYGLLPFLAWASRLIHVRAFRGLQGRNYQFQNHQVWIDQDELGQIWLRVRQINSILPNFLNSGTALHRIAPQFLRKADKSVGLEVRADALLRYFEKTTCIRSSKFAFWLRTQIIEPAEKQRGL